MLPEDILRRRIPLPDGSAEIAVLDWGGDGPLALMHHANGFCGALFEPLALRLRDRFHVVAMDARGHGDSSTPDPTDPENYEWLTMARDVVAVAEALIAESGQDRIALGIGHSFGGTLTMLAESTRPGLFERIFMIDPVTPPPAEILEALGGSPGLLLAQRARKRRQSFESRDAARRYFLERELFQAFEPRALELYVNEGLRPRAEGGVVLKCSGEAEAAVFEGNQDLDLFALLAGLRPHTHFLWARRGNFPIDAYHRLAADMDKATVEDVDCAHLVLMEEPALVVDSLERFLARTA